MGLDGRGRGKELKSRGDLMPLFLNLNIETDLSYLAILTNCFSSIIL